MIEHQLGSRLRELSLRLIEHRLVRLGVNREKNVAFFHVATVLKIPRGDLTADLRLHLDRFKRGARSDLVEVEWNIFLRNFRYGDRSRRGRRRRFLSAGEGAQEQEQDDERYDASKDMDALAAEPVFEMHDCFACHDVDSGHGGHCSLVPTLARPL